MISFFFFGFGLLDCFSVEYLLSIDRRFASIIESAPLFRFADPAPFFWLTPWLLEKVHWRGLEPNCKRRVHSLLSATFAASLHLSLSLLGISLVVGPWVSRQESPFLTHFHATQCRRKCTDHLFLYLVYNLRTERYKTGQ